MLTLLLIWCIYSWALTSYVAIINAQDFHDKFIATAKSKVEAYGYYLILPLAIIIAGPVLALIHTYNQFRKLW